MEKVIRIGSRDSNLALWQAKHIEGLLQKKGYATELVLVKSEGDINLTSPLYEMGVQGIFTKTLDIALLTGKIDIAVHSLKDVPTQLPQGLTIAAIPLRANVKDVLVVRQAGLQLDGKYPLTSIRASKNCTIHRIGQGRYLLLLELSGLTWRCPTSLNWIGCCRPQRRAP